MQYNKTPEFKKEQLEKAKKYALSKNGECLSNEYINFYTPLVWKCHNLNHNSWIASYNSIVAKNSWYPECANNKLLDGLSIAKEHTQSKGCR